MFTKILHRKPSHGSPGRMLLKTGMLMCVALLISWFSLSQSCLPEGITFTTQSQIDSFPINYPGCTEIEGFVQIGNWGVTDITNLTGLSLLTSVGEDLYIVYNDSLTSLIGLEGVTLIGGDFKIMGNHAIICMSEMVGLTIITESLYIWYNYALTSLELQGLTSIGEHLIIGANGHLTNLSGLEEVTSIGGNLGIWSNYSLFSLSGLEGVTSIGEGLEIEDNNSLTDLTGLEGVTSIGGGSLKIINNDALSSLEGLKNIESNTIEGLHIHDNYLLSTCEVESVCAYLASPNGGITISENATGCNSPEEVQDSCIANSVHINEQVIDDIVMFYPNPCNRELNISAEGYIIDEISIYNKLGQRVIHEVKTNNTIDVSWLPEGMYFAVMRSKEGVSVIKMIKQ